MRQERDSLGIIEIEDDKLWGAQTERSLRNFSVGNHPLPISVIRAIALIKKAAALANKELGVIDEERSSWIIKGAEAIISGSLDEHFPLSSWQTGSGTQSNMNVNEVIANYASLHANEELGSHKPIHPNDDVNRSQSSNDLFPTAMHIAILKSLDLFLNDLRDVIAALSNKVMEFQDIVKCGRTHFMDAVPMTLGNEFSAYLSQLNRALEQLMHARKPLYALPIGGTALGTGLNAPESFDIVVTNILKDLSSYPLVSNSNKFDGISSSDSILYISGVLNAIATISFKMANDIRILSSGPRCGIGEINIPANEPGSSIMPGKVNPTQCEMLTQVALAVMGNNNTISVASSQGILQLQVYRPLMIRMILESIEILGGGLKNFATLCLSGVTPNQRVIDHYLEHSLMLVTALSPKIGYDNAAKVAKLAYDRSITLKQAALELNFISEGEFDELINPRKMI